MRTYVGLWYLMSEDLKTHYSRGMLNDLTLRQYLKEMTDVYFLKLRISCLYSLYI